MTIANRVWARNALLASITVSVALGIGPAAAVEPTTIGETAARIGETSMVVRSVQGILPTQKRVLAVSAPVHASEIIETGAESAARITFLDNTELSTGPNSQVTLDQFVYSADPSGQKMAIGIGKGMMRFVTGAMDKRAYEVKTQGAIIGFRGTSIMIVTPGSTAPIFTAQDLSTIPEVAAALEQFKAQNAEVPCLLGAITVRFAATTDPSSPPTTLTCNAGESAIKVGDQWSCGPFSAIVPFVLQYLFTQEAVNDGVENSEGLEIILAVWKKPEDSAAKVQTANATRSGTDADAGGTGCSSGCK